MRIDNPTGSDPAVFSGVVTVGMDANGDGKVTREEMQAFWRP